MRRFPLSIAFVLFAGLLAPAFNLLDQSGHSQSPSEHQGQVLSDLATLKAAS